MPGKPIQAGKLRNRLELQTASEAANASGELIQTWSTAATRWGAVEPLSGRELWVARQTQAQVTHQITLRFYSGLTPKYRIKWGSRYFQVESVLSLDEVGSHHRVLAIEVTS